MYCKLLDAAIKRLKENKEIVEELPITIERSVSSHIPSSYIEDQWTRVDIYKTIASIDNIEESYKMIDELIDRFGEPPISVLNLIDSVLIRNIAKILRITDVSQKGEVVYFKLTNETPMHKIIKYISNKRTELYITSAKTPVLVYKPLKYESSSVSKNILKILNEINNIEGE